MGTATQPSAALQDPRRYASLSLLLPPTVWAPQAESYLRSAEPLTDLSAKDAVAALQTPAQTLAWVDDYAHPVSTAEQLHRLIPRSQLSIAEAPDDLATWPARVAQFVHRHRS